jgi:hypothetical protein
MDMEGLATSRQHWNSKPWMDMIALFSSAFTELLRGGQSRSPVRRRAVSRSADLGALYQ